MKKLSNSRHKLVPQWVYVAIGILLVSAAIDYVVLAIGVPKVAERVISQALQEPVQFDSAVTRGSDGVAFSDGSVQKSAQATAATFVVCASNAKNTNRCDFKATGIADNLVLQAAINALPEYGGIVQLTEGMFIVDDTVYIDRSNVTFRGSRGSVISLANDRQVNVLQIGRGADTADDIWRATIDSIRIEGNKRWQTDSGDQFKQNGIAIIGSPTAQVYDTLIQNVEVAMAFYHSILVTTYVRRTQIHGSYFHDNGGSGIRPDFNQQTLVEGNYSYLNADYGIYPECGSANLIQGNYTFQNGKGGINLYCGAGGDTAHVVVGNLSYNEPMGIFVHYVSANTIVGNNVLASEGGVGIEVQGAVGKPAGNNTIVANRVNGRTGIKIDGTNATAPGNILALNIATADAAVFDITPGNHSTYLRANANWKTESSGTATVSSGATTAIVVHGLSQAPSARDCHITPTNDMGKATKARMTDFNPTTFTIHTDVDPGLSTATFSWQCAIY